ncbi:MAG: hypothetical protein HY721_29900 [Planctomycetes bacterium]|nr:hypothetical protein [Planctomycetota bacterium]
MKSTKRTGGTVRRSVALQGRLVDEAMRAAPPDLAGNWNGIVTLALREFVARKKELEFEEAMAQMARDPRMRAVSGEISKDFLAAEEDGLGR